MSIAFFLSPEGHLVRVPSNHISMVIAEPERFELTIEEIRAAYEKHGERIGVEGEARNELILKVVSQGWIRIRRYENYWSVTAPSLEPSVWDRLQNWAGKMLSGTNYFKEAHREMFLKISTPEGEIHSTIGDLADGTCFSEE